MLYSSAFFFKLSLLIDATGLDVKQMLRAALCTMAEFVMLML